MQPELVARLASIQNEMKRVAMDGIAVPGGASFSMRLRELEEEADDIREQLGLPTNRDAAARTKAPRWALPLGLVCVGLLVAVVWSLIV